FQDLRAYLNLDTHSLFANNKNTSPPVVREVQARICVCQLEELVRGCFPCPSFGALMTNDNIRLCEPTSTLDAEILRLYEGAFPAAERESVERLSELLSKGKQLCHRTLNDKGELLCFTIVTLGEDFNFLAYMATDPTRRSSGIGSKHLARL